MKKVLFVASLDKHLRRFHSPSMLWFKSRGWEVHVAASGNSPIEGCDVMHHIDFIRSPFSLGHYKAYKQLKEVLEKERFSMINTNTPMASVVARLAARKFRKRDGLKLLYTIHGQYFFKGGPLFNWLTYYPMEQLLAKITDCSLIINKEDYDFAIRKFGNHPLRMCSGMGVDTKVFKPVHPDKKQLIRDGLGLKKDDFVIIYVAEYIKRKNHELIVRAASTIKQKIPNLQILFAGRGVLMDEMKNLAANLKVDPFIHFLGFRNDISDVIQSADVGVSASRQEGMGINLMEEMFCGLPVVASQERGHREYIRHGINGFLFDQGDSAGFIKYIIQLYENPALYSELATNALKITSIYNLEKATEELGAIYSEFM